MSDHGWVSEIRRIYGESFSLCWGEHLDELNQRADLEGDDRLVTPAPHLPPAWFNGDIEMLEPGQWVLVISLNPGLGGDPESAAAMYADKHFTAQQYWDYWRKFNTFWWYPRFFRPLVHVAAGALGEKVLREKEAHFATERMLFVEVCPYASRRFRLSSRQLAELAENDIGFQIERKIRDVAMYAGKPAIVLVNGSQAVATVSSDDDRIQWSETWTASTAVTEKRLRHWQGQYQTIYGMVPIAGFPFLRTRNGFTSNQEISQLAGHLRAFVTAR